MSLVLSNEFAAAIQTKTCDLPNLSHFITTSTGTVEQSHICKPKEIFFSVVIPPWTVIH